MLTIEGAERVASRLLLAATAAKKAVPDALDKAALLVVRSAKQKAPVDTGFLRSTIAASRPWPGQANVTSHAEYSIYQEFGTSKMPAQPYMGPALDENREEIERILGSGVRTALHKVMP